MKCRSRFSLQCLTVFLILLAAPYGPYSTLAQDMSGDVDDDTTDFYADRYIPQGSASLAFVFDITGSMYDDLVQVIEGAAKILATTLARREKPLYNYVLVPFHDPGQWLITLHSKQVHYD